MADVKKSDLRMEGYQPLEERLWDKVDKTENECWEWIGATNPDGYGRIYVGGNVRQAHRVAYLLECDDISDGMHVLHECDNPPCVNPEHLKTGTHSENIKEIFDKDRKDHSGENNPNSDLTEDDVEEIRKKYDSGVYQTVLASEFDVSQNQISRIVNGECW